MLDNEVIQHSHSPWNSPMFLVPKKGGKFRPVVDFRKVNLHTTKDPMPIPVMGDILKSIGNGNKMFSTLDLKSAFWQIELDPESKAVTAFSTDRGHFEFNRMPFGLKNAPSTLQRLMNQLFNKELGRSLFVYLYDLIVFSPTVEQHLDTL